MHVHNLQFSLNFCEKKIYILVDDSLALIKCSLFQFNGQDNILPASMLMCTSNVHSENKIKSKKIIKTSFLITSFFSRIYIYMHFIKPFQCLIKQITKVICLNSLRHYFSLTCLSCVLGIYRKYGKTADQP